jgi:hypothetical protein
VSSYTQYSGPKTMRREDAVFVVFGKLIAKYQALSHISSKVKRFDTSAVHARYVLCFCFFPGQSTSTDTAIPRSLRLIGT